MSFVSWLCSVTCVANEASSDNTARRFPRADEDICGVEVISGVPGTSSLGFSVRRLRGVCGAGEGCDTMDSESVDENEVS